MHLASVLCHFLCVLDGAVVDGMALLHLGAGLVQMVEVVASVRPQTTAKESFADPVRHHHVQDEVAPALTSISYGLDQLGEGRHGP